MSGLPAGERGVFIDGDDVTVKGLNIAWFDEYGIDIYTGARARIQGNFIGTRGDGNQAGANEVAGIRVQQPATATLIGGTSPADRNVISGFGRPSSARPASSLMARPASQFRGT